MTDLSGPKDLMCHIWHLQLIYDKRQQLGAAADKWSRQQYTEYVLRAMQDADVAASMLEAMYKEMPESQRGYVNLEYDNPNDRDFTQPVDEDQERIQFMKQTLFEMQAKAIKKYMKKRDGGIDSSESDAPSADPEKMLDFGMSSKIKAKDMPRANTPPPKKKSSTASAVEAEDNLSTGKEMMTKKKRLKLKKQKLKTIRLDGFVPQRHPQVLAIAAKRQLADTKIQIADYRDVL
eukprot:s2303_g4.t1